MLHLLRSDLFERNLLRLTITAAEISGKLLPQSELLELLCLTGHFLIKAPISEKQTNRFVLFGNAALYKKVEYLDSVLSICPCYQAFFNDSQKPYVVTFPFMDTTDWRGRSTELTKPLSHHFKDPGADCALIIPGEALDIVPYDIWMEPTVDVCVQSGIMISHLIGRRMDAIQRNLVKLALLFIQIPMGICHLARRPSDIRLLQNQFVFSSMYAEKVMRTLKPGTALYNDLTQGLVQLAMKWTFFCSWIPVARRLAFKSVMIEALDFVMQIFTDSAILESLDDDLFEDIRECVSSCLQSVLSSHGVNMKKSANFGVVTSSTQSNEGWEWDTDSHWGQSNRMEHTLAKLAALDESVLSKVVVGRVLDTESDSRNHHLAMLSRSMPGASIKWQKGRFLSQGSSGSVFLGINLDTATYIAVKEIEFASEEDIKALQGAETMLTLLHHPNVVAYYGMEVHRQKLYILMEYCTGSLERILSNGRIEDENVIRKYAIQMLKGLQYLHSQEVVHHDVKPSNILFDREGTLKFVDFGCSEIKNRNTITVEKDSYNLVGTARYLPPEVVRSEKDAPKKAHDIWALGCTVSQMATGRLPWDQYDNEWAVMFHIGLGEVPELPSESQLSMFGIDFVRLCLTTSPFERPTASQLLEHVWIMDAEDVSVV